VVRVTALASSAFISDLQFASILSLL
jgi:hypothetical protein